MRILTILGLMMFLFGCERFRVTNVDNHLLMQDKTGEFSCYSGGANYAFNCCYPWKESLMICLYSTQTEIDEQGRLNLSKKQADPDWKPEAEKNKEDDPRHKKH